MPMFILFFIFCHLLLVKEINWKYELIKITENIAILAL